MTSPLNEIIMPASGKDTQLLIAVPKKGRLVEAVNRILKGAGLDHVRYPRLDIAQCTRLPVTIVFLPAADIAKYVGAGDVDLGITGQDIVSESGVEVDELLSLEIGRCRLCVQAPAGHFQSAEELVGKRIVTSFPDTARAFFAKFEEGQTATTQIRYVAGSVEVACSLGLADGIVDLVETGTTMRAAGLEIVDTIMHTETVLIANPRSTKRALIEKIHQRIHGFVLASKNVMITYNIPESLLRKAVGLTPGHEAPTLVPLDKADWISVSALVPKKEANEVMDKLKSIGAKSILIMDIASSRF